VNQKIIILSDESDYVAVDHYFFNDCIRFLIDRIRLDEQWYLNKYPDVKQAIAKKTAKDAKEHFVRFGYFEHRLPYRIEVQEGGTLSNIPTSKKPLSSASSNRAKNILKLTDSAKVGLRIRILN
jgi:hypothetical protein